MLKMTTQIVAGLLVVILMMIDGIDAEAKLAKVGFTHTCPPGGKSCLRVPQNCADDCTAQVSWVLEADQTVKFLIHGVEFVKGGYAAVGLSRDKLMAETYVYACWEEGGKVSISEVYLETQNNRTLANAFPPPPKPINNLVSSFKEQITKCSFDVSLNGFEYLRYPLKTKDSDEKISFDSSTTGEYFFLLAAGPIDNERDYKLGYHEKQKDVSGPLDKERPLGALAPEPTVTKKLIQVQDTTKSSGFLGGTSTIVKMAVCLAWWMPEAFY